MSETKLAESLYDVVKKYVKLLENSNLGLIDHTDENGRRIKVIRYAHNNNSMIVNPAIQPTTKNTATRVNLGAENLGKIEIIKSQFIGTFTFPDEEKSILVNDKIFKDQVIGQIFVLKSIRENVIAPITGIVKKVYVNNGDTVDYDKPLFEIEIIQ